MKKSIVTTLTLLVTAGSVLAQGSVYFSNLPNFLPSPPDRKVYADLAMTQPITDTAAVAWLQFSTDQGTSWQDATVATGSPRKNFLGTTLPGVWTAGVVLLPGTTTGQSIQLRVGAELAGVQGYSDPFGFTVQAPGSPPSAIVMSGFQAFGVPEPSTIALGVLGLGALLLFRRRK